MICPKCGGKNQDDVQVCSSCGVALSKASYATENPVPRMSRFAIAAFVCAILSPFTFGVTFFAAIVFGVISISTIDKSGGRLTGRNFAILSIIIPCVMLLGWILISAVLHEIQTKSRRICGMNLLGIGKAMFAYANDYDGQLPHSAGEGATWSAVIESWAATNRFNAYGLAPDGSRGRGSISSCFYLLVKYANVMPSTFICPGDPGASIFNPAAEGFGDRQLVDLWDFGPASSEHCSYSYHQPFGRFPLTSSSEPGMAVAADRNPWIRSPAYEAKTFPGRFNPDGDREAVRAGNAISHQEDGQNVLFMDNHASFEKRAFCSVKDDNIYTFWDGGDIRIGSCPVGGISESQDKADSLLVHDTP